jgi:biopolymer transport protein ExbB
VLSQKQQDFQKVKLRSYKQQTNKKNKKIMVNLLNILLQVIDEPQVQSQSLNLFDLILKGGIIMLPIFLLSFLSIYIMFERYTFIRKAGKIDKSFMQNIKQALHKGQPQEALELCRKLDSPIAHVIEKGIHRIGLPIKDIQDEIQTVGSIEMSKMENKLAYLGLVAGTAPMLGFIGTIMGIIKIFYNISLSDNISIGIIAGGLYEKMITSCAGLIVGVVAYTGYHFLNMMIDKFALQVEITASEFIDLLREPIKK